MIAIYDVEYGAATLALCPNEVTAREGHPYEMWSSRETDLPSTVELATITEWLIDRHYRVHGTWHYDEAADSHRATVSPWS